MVEFCRFYPDKRCFHSSCSIFDCVSGNIFVCPLFRGGDMFTLRKITPVHVSVFSKHVLRRGGSCK